MTDNHTIPLAEAVAIENGGVESLDDVVSRLAGLPPIEYDRVRVEEADRIGCRLTTLDDEVNRKRAKPNDNTESAPAIFMNEPERWPELSTAA